MDYEKKIDIPFGAFDSELYYQEINIPDGFEATIKDNKVMLKKKEIEDEEIRKALMEMIFDTPNIECEKIYKISKEKCIAWLEKQGESYTKRDIDNAFIEGMAFAKNELEKQGEQKETLCDKCKKEQPSHSCQDITALGRCALEKQSIKPKESTLTHEAEVGNGNTKGLITEKVQMPKFHEGEWVVFTAGELSKTLQIVNVDTDKKLYWFNDNSYLPIVDEECLHHWTIQDAKDGDVLISELNNPFLYNGNRDSFYIGAYGGLSTRNNFHVAEGVCSWTEYVSIHPATKEQCDLLFKKMKEYGYEWDAENKKLNKVETFDKYEGLPILKEHLLTFVLVG